MTAARANVHGTAIVLGTRGFLITGPSGIGKSRLALACITAARQAGHFAALVADDRVDLRLEHDRIIARCPPSIHGLIEIRGLGIRRLSYEPVALVGLVVDLDEAGAERLPASTAAAELTGVTLPRLCVAPAADPLGLLIAALRTADSGH